MAPLTSRLLPLLFVLCGPWLRGLPAQVSDYHDVSSTTHQQQFNLLSALGYRLVSLSVAGDINTPRYSAVWEQISGPAWVSAHDMSLAQFVSTRQNWINQGYRAKLLTAAGSASNVVFAAVFVNDGASVFDSWNLPEASMISVFDAQRAYGRFPVSVDIYGPSSSASYCCVFEPNSGDRVWGWDIDANANEFATTRAAHREGGERLGALGMSDSLRYVSVWYDDRVGTENIASNQTSSGWQAVSTTWTNGGLHPRIVASGGSGTSARFAGSFAEYRTPLFRLTSTTGVARPQFAAFDSYMTSLLHSTGARAAQLAIAKDGKLVYARAFTHAENGYPITQPTDAFRVASCSKPLTALAAHRADELGLLSMATKPQVALGITNYATNFDHIEMHHLLEYTSGLVRNYDSWSIANQLNPPTLPPVTMSQGVQWLAAKDLVFAPTNPSTQAKYSNTAFFLAGEVVRARAGMPLLTFLQNRVLSPLDITRIRVAPSEASQFTAADVPQHLSQLALYASELYSDGRRRSAQFTENLTLKQASGGFTASAVDYVRLLAGVFDLRGAEALVLSDATVADVLARHSYTDFDDPMQTQDVCLGGMAWTDLGNGVFSYHKGGTLNNTSTVIAHRTDGVSWAAFVNKGDSHASQSTLDAMIDAVGSWPNVDEFPSYGLPAFPRRPRVSLVLPASLANVTASHFTLTGERLDTATQVTLGSHVITSTSPTNWQNGYFTITNGTSMRVYPPQGLLPGTYPLTVANGVGAGDPVYVSLSLDTTFRLAAPTVVNANQPWSVYATRGTASGLTTGSGFVIFCLSSSNQPTSVPGIVSLGLGNQFADLLTSGAFQFSAFTGAVRLDLPPLPSGTVYLEAVGLDVGWPSLFPLLTTNTTATTRL